jgi:hypothetical protein
MTDLMTLETSNETTSEQTPEITADAAQEQPASSEVSNRPDGLPDKFWDEQNAGVRTDALLKSYLSLEKRLGGEPVNLVPESADHYEIKSSSDLVSFDSQLNTRLHQAGFSQDQAQLVYDLASEHLHPLVTQMSAELDAQHQVNRLAEEFGGQDSWRALSRQISSWGKANYPAEVYQALASSVDGVKSMHQMMRNGEPGLLEQGDRASGGVSESSLKTLMRDPRYWRDQNPAVVAEVREGFQKLYPDKD